MSSTTPYVNVYKNARDGQGRLLPGPQLLAEATAFHNNDNMSIYCVRLSTNDTNFLDIGKDCTQLATLLIKQDTLFYRTAEAPPNQLLGATDQLLGYPAGDELPSVPAPFADRIKVQKLVSQEELLRLGKAALSWADASGNGGIQAEVDLLIKAHRELKLGFHGLSYEFNECLDKLEFFEKQAEFDETEQVLKRLTQKINEGKARVKERAESGNGNGKVVVDGIEWVPRK